MAQGSLSGFFFFFVLSLKTQRNHTRETESVIKCHKLYLNNKCLEIRVGQWECEAKVALSVGNAPSTRIA